MTTTKKNRPHHRLGLFLAGGLGGVLVISWAVARLLDAGGPASSASPPTVRVEGRQSVRPLAPNTLLERSSIEAAAGPQASTAAGREAEVPSSREVTTPDQRSLRDIVQVYCDPPWALRGADRDLCMIPGINTELRWVLILQTPGKEAALDQQRWAPPVIHVLEDFGDRRVADLHPYLTCKPVDAPREVEQGGWQTWQRALESGDPESGRPRDVPLNSEGVTPGFDLEYPFSIVIGPTGELEHYGRLEIRWRGEVTYRRLEILPAIDDVGTSWNKESGEISSGLDLNFTTTIDRISFELREGGLAVVAEVVATTLTEGNQFHVDLRPLRWPTRDPSLTFWVTLDSGQVVSTTSRPFGDSQDH